jgi:hypothetical protein
MVYGVCCMVYGVWRMAYGVWCTVVERTSSSTTTNATSTGGCVGVVWLLCWVVVVGLFVVLGWRCVSVGGSGTDQQQHDCHHYRLVCCVVYGVWCTVYGVWCVVYGVWCVLYGVWRMLCGVGVCGGGWGVYYTRGERGRGEVW